MRRPHAQRPRRRRSESGSVTAEAALVLPTMALFALALVWMIGVAIAQVRVVDAARDAAREVARGGDIAAADGQARRTAPDGSRVQVNVVGGQATVSVTCPASPPAWMILPLPTVDVHATATVAVEGSPR